MHADPHPGNLVVDANTGALTYLDFGMTVTVDARRRSAMLRGLVGFVNRDARSLVLRVVSHSPTPVSVQLGVNASRADAPLWANATYRTTLLAAPSLEAVNSWAAPTAVAKPMGRRRSCEAR